MNQYETVFIMTPVLSDQQMKETVEKFKGILTAAGAEIINEEEWGLKTMAYPIQKSPLASMSLSNSRLSLRLLPSSKSPIVVTSA